MGVSTNPGHTTLTFTPNDAASIWRASDRPTTACFVAAYAPSAAAGTSPAADAVFTM